MGLAAHFRDPRHRYRARGRLDDPEYLISVRAKKVYAEMPCDIIRGDHLGIEQQAEKSTNLPVSNNAILYGHYITSAKIVPEMPRSTVSPDNLIESPPFLLDFGIPLKPDTPG